MSCDLRVTEIFVDKIMASHGRLTGQRQDPKGDITSAVWEQMLHVDTRKITFTKSIVCPARGFADFLNRVSTIGKCTKARHLIKFRRIQSSGSRLRETLPPGTSGSIWRLPGCHN